MTLWLATLLLAAEPGALVVLDAGIDAKDDEISAAFGPATVQRAEAAKDQELEDQKKLVKLALDTVKAARKAALELRTDEAIQKFEEAQNLFGRGIAALDDFQPMAQGLLDLGAAFVDKGKDDKATTAFRRALALGAGVKPDPKVYNPDVLSRFAKVEKELVRATRGSMTIVSKPEGAEVYFDGKKVGATPLSLNDLLLGEHWIVVRLAGHHRFSARVVVTKDRVDRTEVFLRALPPPASPLARLVDGVRKGGLDRALAAEVMKSASVLIVVAQGDPLRAITIDGRGERLLQGATIAALGRAAKEAPVAKAEPKLEVESAATKPIELKPASGRRQVHWAVAILPAGIGQFAEGRYGWGAFFLVTQVVFLAANIASFFLVQADRVPGTSPPEFRNPQRSEAFKWVSNIGFALLIADVIAGGIDGVLHRH